MRDPKRIPRISNKLEKLWKLMPDMRLGQLISYVDGADDSFYTEDSEMESKIDKLIIKHRDKRNIKDPEPWVG